LAKVDFCDGLLKTGGVTTEIARYAVLAWSKWQSPWAPRRIAQATNGAGAADHEGAHSTLDEKLRGELALRQAKALANDPEPFIWLQFEMIDGVHRHTLSEVGGDRGSLRRSSA
jgi:hypothetical protein